MPLRDTGAARQRNIGYAMFVLFSPSSMFLFKVMNISEDLQVLSRPQLSSYSKIFEEKWKEILEKLKALQKVDPQKDQSDFLS